MFQLQSYNAKDNLFLRGWMTNANKTQVYKNGGGFVHLFKPNYREGNYNTYSFNWACLQRTRLENGFYTVYSVLNDLTGTSIGLQPCLTIIWYDRYSNIARVYTTKARIYSVKQGLSRFEHNLHNDLYTIAFAIIHGHDIRAFLFFKF